MKKIFEIKFLAVVVFALLAFVIFMPGSASAASFDAGRIIDDSVFNNKSSMSVGDIQNFLNSKVPTCDTYHAPGPGSQGANPPWTCLKNYNEGGKSAAQIIWEQAQNYSINPQVLLVTLQKENGLITDDWPYPWQYRTAMGFGCPDGEPCDAQWFGFTNQVSQAARHFRNFYDLNPNWSIPHRPGLNFIRWNPNSACGGTNVNIQNRATAALYSYTPYQPNSAALNNLYGSGDDCSAYGNRNFWRDFNNWFGNTSDEPNESNISWNFESLDGSQSAISGQDGAIGQTPRTIQFGTSIQVFYYDATNGNLKRSHENGGGWVTEVLDGAGGSNGRINSDLGKMPSVVIYNNNLHVFYYDATNGDLRHGVSDASGSNWTFETLDGDGSGPSRASSRVGVNSAVSVLGDTIQVFHYDDTYGNLRHSWYVPGVGWLNENLDGDPGSVGRANSSLGEDPEVVIYNSQIQLYYYDVSNGNLRHAWTSSRGWNFENLDGDPGSVGRANSNLGRNPSIAIHNSQIQLYYYDVSNGNLRHAWTSSRGWNFENLDGDPGSIFRRNKTTGMTPKVLSYNNVLYLFYYDQTDGELRYAYADATGWHKAGLDGGYNSISKRFANSGIDPTVVAFNGSIQLYYYDFSYNNLMHAWGIAP